MGTKENPHSYYIWCFAHRLNLCLEKATKVPKIKIVINMCKNLLNFLRENNSRKKVFNEIKEEKDTTSNNSSYRTLKRFCDTRWSCNFEMINSIYLNYPIIIKALRRINDEKIFHNPLDVSNLINCFTQYENLVLIAFLDKILHNINKLSKMFQTKQLNIVNAFLLVEDLKNELKTYKSSSFKELFIKINEMVEHANISEQQEEYYIENNLFTSNDDERCSYFYQKIIKEFIDELNDEVNERFNDNLTVIMNAAIALNPINNFEKWNVDSIILLCIKYSNIFPFTEKEIKEEGLFFLDYIKKEGFNSLEKIYIDMDHYKMLGNFPIYSRIIILILTLGISSSEAERGFSKRDLIINYLRNNNSEDRSENLIIISANSDLAKPISIDHLTEKFLKSSRKFSSKLR